MTSTSSKSNKQQHRVGGSGGSGGGDSKKNKKNPTRLTPADEDDDVKMEDPKIDSDNHNDSENDDESSDSSSDSSSSSSDDDDEDEDESSNSSSNINSSSIEHREQVNTDTQVSKKKKEKNDDEKNDDHYDDAKSATSSSSSDSSSDNDSEGGDDDDDDEEEGDEHRPNNDNQISLSQSQAENSSTAAAPAAAAATTLSKSWSIQAAHVPTFTGGKVSSSLSSPLASIASSTAKAAAATGGGGGGGGKGSKHPQPPPFLLLPVHGDLSIVDSIHGVSWGTIRKGPKAASSVLALNEDTNNSGDGDDDDDDGLDHDSITCYALSSDNRTIITCSRNNLLRQYEVQVVAVQQKNDPSGSPLHDDDDDNDNQDRHENQDTNNDMDGTDVSDNDDDNKIARKVTTKLARTWGRSGHTLPVTHMAFHSSNVFVATGSVDGTVRIWDVRGRYITHVFRPVGSASTPTSSSESTGRYGISCVKWKPQMDELVVAIGRDDGSIAIHNLRAAVAAGSSTETTTSLSVNSNGSNNHHPSVLLLTDHISAVTCMEWWRSGSSSTASNAFTSTMSDTDDEFFITTGRDSVINLWRVVLPTTEAVDVDNNISSSKHKKKKKNSRKSSRTIMYRRIQTIPVYEQVEGMVVLPPSSFLKESMNELSLVTAGSKGVLRKWSARVKHGETPQLTKTLEQPSKQAFGDARGGYMGLLMNDLASNAIDAMIAIDAEHNLCFVNSELALDRTIVGHNDEILDLKIIPNSSSIVVATNSPQVRVFDLKNFSCTVLDGHTATALCVDASPCGRYLASCGKDRTLRIWRAKNGYECLGVGSGHTEPIGACGFSQKVGKYEVGGRAAQNGGGAFCITASVDRTLKRWNLMGPDEWKETSNDDNDEGDKAPVELLAAISIRGHEKDINIISVAPNDSLIASGSQDKTVKLWNATDMSHRATLKGHKRGVWDCQFSPIDRVLATSSGDKTIKIWSLADFSCVRTFQGHLSSVLRVRFLSTGLQLVSAGADGLLKVWTIRTNECETTLDAHSDKVWAMDLANGGDHTFGEASQKDLLVSGSADSSLLVWNDTTAEMEEEQRANKAESILLDQQLANHLRHKEFSKALEIALKVNKPMHALKVLTALLESELSNRKKGEGMTDLQRLVVDWDLDRIAQVLKYCREWNTRARNSHVAMWVLRAIVTTVPVGRLASSKASQTTHGSIPEIMAGIMPYAERHFDRLDRLYGSSYLLDFLLYNMDSLDPVLGANVEDNGTVDEFARWQASSKPALPPKFVDGRIQVSGTVLVGVGDKSAHGQVRVDESDNDDSDEVLTVGDSSDSGSESDDE